MNEILKYEGREVRMVTRDGEPWWVAKDVCEILELGTTAKALERLDDDEKGMNSIHTLGGQQQVAVVNETGLYTLVLGSRKPEAKRFKRWITHEVLPSIRKTGKYDIAAPAPTKFEIMRNMLDAWEAHETQLVQHDRQIGSLNTHVATLEHRVDLFGADTDYRTVRAHLRESGVRMGEKDARAVGVKAASLCRARDILIGDVADERHGSVHSYPIDVLNESVAFVQSRPKQAKLK